MLATAGGADIASYVGVPAVALRPLAPWVRGLSLQIRQRHGSVEQVRATFGFRSRHFVASNPIYILLDICRLGLYTNAVLLRVAVMFARMSPPSLIPPVQSRKSVGPNSDASIREAKTPDLCKGGKIPVAKPSSWQLTNTLTNVRNGLRHKKDVKKEDRTDYVHENTGSYEKMASNLSSFLPDMHLFRENPRKPIGLLAESKQVKR